MLTNVTLAPLHHGWIQTEGNVAAADNTCGRRAQSTPNRLATGGECALSTSLYSRNLFLVPVISENPKPLKPLGFWSTALCGQVGSHCKPTVGHDYDLTDVILRSARKHLTPNPHTLTNPPQVRAMPLAMERNWPELRQGSPVERPHQEVTKRTDRPEANPGDSPRERKREAVVGGRRAIDDDVNVDSVNPAVDSIHGRANGAAKPARPAERPAEGEPRAGLATPLGGGPEG
eukprot:1188240-Prorocentrum_minimum.AAC.1